MRYFAFITRDADRRYHATLPDFPGCRAQARSLGALAPAIVRAIDTFSAGPPTRRLPKPTAASALPVPDAAHDGYWLQVDVSAAARRAARPRPVERELVAG